jgi:hypothetical protein
MKWTTLIITLLGLIACSNRTDKNGIDGKAQTVYADSLHNDSNERKNAGGQPYAGLHTCNFDNLIADKKTPTLAKDIYLDKNWNLNNDNEALALLDSLTAKNKTSRAFYVKVVTKTYAKSDGYFSEALGLAGKEYIENNTAAFISNFDHKECFTPIDLNTWADIVMLEMKINDDGNSDNPIVDEYVKKLQSNCKNCSPTQKENIDQFGVILQHKWKTFLKKNKQQSLGKL